ncbi:MAG: subtilisin family serine protease [Glaciecola sp.]|jgi:subtilisin family serine protease
MAFCVVAYSVSSIAADNEVAKSGIAAISNNLSSSQVVKSNNNPSKGRFLGHRKFTYEPDLQKNTLHTYIVELNELAVAQEPQAIAEMVFQKQRANANANNRQANSLTSKDYSQNYAVNRQIDKIVRQQQAFLDQSAAQLINFKILTSYKYGINGMAIRVTQLQAQALSQLSQVKRIQREQTRTLNTDRGPVLIGAPKVWDGTAFSGVAQTFGEGIIIGIIDSGVNTDHLSFAEIAGDGYVHTNPRGDGNYLGDCASIFAELCNNKLIGVYSYTDITDDYTDTSIFPPNLPRNGEDYGGHGSHVASIAAGNILINVDEVFPTVGEERSSGTPTGFTFDKISGVAPRANIISYQVCYGGTNEREDTYADCLDSPILKAIDDAIRDNVDVINFSISGGGNPWLNPTEQAFLSARNAGIFVAVSADNSGPEPITSEKTAPWYTAVAASEHGRENVFSKQLNGFTGGASTLNAMVGQSNTGSFTAPIVYAGDFGNTNDPGGDSAQCLEPFPEGTFSGQIVVCDRGEIARIQKAVNVRDGGAGGYVLVNVDGSETFLANDQYVIPGIHIDASNGNNLKAWLRTGQNHRANITGGVPTQTVDASRVDVLADYSSRGPNDDISTLLPTMAAPGSNIFAAYADEQLGHDGHEPAASDFTTLSGTSMSSPHVAGAAALIKAANPTWGPDEIRSALALTATTAMQKEDGTTQADFFDMGSGRIQVDKAIASPLIMTETSANYANANPSSGGEPRNLNLPSITDNQCAGICSWSRSFTATTDATFTYAPITISTGLTVTATPSSFTLLAGQSQKVSFTIDSLQASKVDYSFALAMFTSPGLPDVALPVSVLSSIGNFPLSVEIEGRREKDSILVKDIEAISIDIFELTAYKPVKSTVLNATITQDTNTNNYVDNVNDGVSITTITVPEDAKRLIAEIKQSSAPDLDLFVLFDADDNGIPTLDEEIAISRSGSSLEEVQINYPQAGTYFIAIQSFLGTPNQTDTFDMRFAVVIDELAGDSLRADAPSTIEPNIPFDLRVIYDLPQSTSDDNYYAAFGIGSSVGEENIELITIDIERVDNDVFVDGTATRLNAGESAPLNVTVKSNPSNEARNYRVVLPLPVGTSFTNFATTNNGQLINNEIVWLVDKPAGSAFDTILNFTIEAIAGVPAGPIIVNAKSELLSLSFAGTETSEDFTSVQVEGVPVISFDGSSTVSLTVTETKNLVIPLTISEPNNDDVTVSFIQISGPTSDITGVQGNYTLLAPLVDADTQLIYDLTVTDTNGNSSVGLITVNVLNNGSPIINSIIAPTNANGGQPITISVSASDPENDTLLLQINGRDFSGTSATLNTPTSGASIRYVVSVGDGVTQTEQIVTVILTQVVLPEPSSGGGGSISWIVLCLLPFGISRRLRKPKSGAYSIRPSR